MEIEGSIGILRGEKRGRRKEEGGRRKEEGGRRKEEGKGKIFNFSLSSFSGA
jgi:hypothetical protein